MPGRISQALATIYNPLVAYAILEAAYFCPRWELENNMCSWIKKTDISRCKTDTVVTQAANDFVKKLGTLLAADSVLAKAIEDVYPITGQPHGVQQPK